MVSKYTLSMKSCCFFVLLSLCLFANEAFAQKLDTLRRKDGDGKYFIQVRNRGLLIEEGYLVNNIQDGIWTTFWHTSFPRELTTYDHGTKNGAHIGITPTGSIELIEHYKNNKLDGPKRSYNGEGQIIEDALYSEGQKHGPYVKWYPNNKKLEESSYVYDKRDGNAIWYFETGSKAAEYSYRNGEIDGPATTYFPNGKVSEYGPYKAGFQSGTWKEYYENGNLKAEGQYVNGDKEGAWKEYNAEGKYQKTTNYKKGEAK